MTESTDCWALRPIPGAAAETFIQWKGTTVCMDFHCPCGSHGHIDAGFAYFIECGSCGRCFELGTAVDVREVAADDCYSPVLASNDWGET